MADDNLWPKTREWMTSRGFSYLGSERRFGPKQSYVRGDLGLTVHFHHRDVGYHIVASWKGGDGVDLTYAALAMGASWEAINKIFWQRIDDDLVTLQLLEYLMGFVHIKLDSESGLAELAELVKGYLAEMRAQLRALEDS